MKNLLEDLISFIQSLSLIDLFFFGSILVLMILVVVLIYIIRLNNDGEDMDDISIIDDEPSKDELHDSTLKKEATSDELNLAEIASAIEEEEPQPIILNNYEKEQEAKAIISYDELVAKKNEPEKEINYKREENLEGLTIKALDMDNLTKPVDLPKMKESTPIQEQVINKNSILISYEKEEAFLEALKKLQSLLN